MKKQSIKGLAFIAAAGVLATSCDLLKDLDYTVTPDPLEMHGDSVRVKVDITLPEKGIKKKAYAEITPMIGEQALKLVTIVGEKATLIMFICNHCPYVKAIIKDLAKSCNDLKKDGINSVAINVK